MLDTKALAAATAAIVREHVEKAVTPLLSRIERLERAFEELPTPRDGKDADQDAVAAIVAERMLPELKELRSAIEALPPAPEMPDVAGMVAEAVKAIPQPGPLPDIPALVAEAVTAIPLPQDGKDADPELVASLVTETAERILAGWERPQDGKDGAPGRDGENGADGAPGKDGADVVDLLIDRSGELVATLSDGRIKNVGRVIGENGKDGAPGLNGKDGADGVGFDDLDLVETEEGVFLRMARGDIVKEFRLPIVIDRGVWKQGTYRKGDGVTWGGGFWICQEDTDEKPETGKGFRLAVKRGRDGKDGKDGDPNPPKPSPVKVG